MDSVTLTLQHRSLMVRSFQKCFYHKSPEGVGGFGHRIARSHGKYVIKTPPLANMVSGTQGRGVTCPKSHRSLAHCGREPDGTAPCPKQRTLCKGARYPDRMCTGFRLRRPELSPGPAFSVDSSGQPCRLSEPQSSLCSGHVIHTMPPSPVPESPTTWQN
jgi:hypothetical protein